jgi:hypothetical protein
MPTVVFLPCMVICLGALSCPQGVADDQPKADLRDQVHRLVQQLGDTDADKQAAAVGALLKLGPEVLPLLPGPDAKLSTDQQKHLQSVRATLRDSQAQKELAPRRFTFKEKSVGLSRALQELSRQTGNAVEDRRQEKEQEPTFSLDLAGVTFWEALDEIAAKADLRLSFYEKDGKLALVDGPHLALPVSTSGVFRTAVKRLTAVRDLEMDRHSWIIQFDVAWEPRLQPLFMEIQPDAVEVRDGKGDTLKNLQGGGGRAAIGRPLSSEAQVRVEAPARPAEKIGLFQGGLTLLGPSRLLSFTFDNLAKVERGKGDRGPKQTQDGVTVQLREFNPTADLWTVGVLLEYPAVGPEFESFESWLVNNEIFLERKDGRGRHAANGGYTLDDSSGRKALLTYRFIEDVKLSLGKPAEWRIVYRTPGAVVPMPVRFEFKDLPAP